MIKCRIFIQEGIKKISVVFQINNTHGFSDTVHGKLWSTDVHCFHSRFGSDHWANCRSTETILLYNEILNWYVCSNSQFSQKRSTCCISHISLISIVLKHNTLMKFWLMLGLMFVNIIRMDSVCHISWHKVTLANTSIIVFLSSILLQCIEDSFCRLHKHVAVSSLGRLWSNFFMIKQHNHTDICIIWVTWVVIN